MRSLFAFPIVNVILAIPRCPYLPKDCLIWNQTPSGLFTVKSGYHFERSLQDQDVRSIHGWFWNKLWGAKTTPRSKLLIWRVCHKALPIKPGLRSRGFYLDQGCSVCLKEAESGTHVLHDCPMAMDVWNLSPLGKLILGPSPSDPARWIMYVAWVMPDESCWNWFIFCLWELWNQRNAWVHGEKTRSAVEIISFVDNYLEEYTRANAQRYDNRSSPLAVRTVLRGWQPPPNGCVKDQLRCRSRSPSRRGRGWNHY